MESLSFGWDNEYDTLWFLLFCLRTSNIHLRLERRRQAKRKKKMITMQQRLLNYANRISFLLRDLTLGSRLS